MVQLFDDQANLFRHRFRPRLHKLSYLSQLAPDLAPDSAKLRGDIGAEGGLLLRRCRAPSQDVCRQAGDVQELLRAAVK